jgi:hypothetical protein
MGLRHARDKPGHDKNNDVFASYIRLRNLAAVKNRPYFPHSSFVASLAPSASASSFAHTIEG